MDTASRSSGRVNEEIRIARKSRPTARSRYPHSSTAKELLNDIQQSCCAIGSSFFQSLNAHRERHSKGCLAKEFSSLVDSDYNEGVSLFLFASNLAQKI